MLLSMYPVRDIGVVRSRQCLFCLIKFFKEVENTLLFSILGSHASLILR